jgi:hypothetical protein
MKLPWQQKEKRDAKRFGARRTHRSGGIWFDPGDSKREDFLFESKDCTDKKGFYLTEKMWDKIEKEATNNPSRKPRTPAILVQLSSGKELVVINHIDFNGWFKQTKA